MMKRQQRMPMIEKRRKRKKKLKREKSKVLNRSLMKVTRKRKRCMRAQ